MNKIFQGVYILGTPSPQSLGTPNKLGIPTEYSWGITAKILSGSLEFSDTRVIVYSAGRQSPYWFFFKLLNLGK